jgi:hypothetical protein
VNSVNIIAYPPGGGGNHLKNIIDLSGNFKDQWPWTWTRAHSVGLTQYDSPLEVPGAVHSLPGRNIHEVFVQHINANAQASYLMHGHFGELAAHADSISQWPSVRWIIIAIDSPDSRQQLLARQGRLQYHPYWLDEEQIFLYRAEMYQRYFQAKHANILTVELDRFWHVDMVRSGVIDSIEHHYQLRIPRQPAQQLHRKWCDLNFGH